MGRVFHGIVRTRSVFMSITVGFTGIDVVLWSLRSYGDVYLVRETPLAL
jgi:hypothetical protein